MLRHTVVRALIGLVVGFVAAYCTFFVVDRYGSPDDDMVATRSGELDFDAYCAELPGSLTAAFFEGPEPRWRCIGRRDGFFTSVEIDIELACQLEYGPEATVLGPGADRPDVWQCVARSG
jgi:hypothetical protein